MNTKEIPVIRRSQCAAIQKEIEALKTPLALGLIQAHARGFVLGRRFEGRNAPNPDLLTALTWIRNNCTGLPAVARALADQALEKAGAR